MYVITHGRTFAFDLLIYFSYDFFFIIVQNGINACVFNLLLTVVVGHNIISLILKNMYRSIRKKHFS